MRALTLTQPYAGLVAAGVKPLENRTRNIIRDEDLGKPFAIHASREIDMGVYEMIRKIAPDLMAGVVYEKLWYRLSRLTQAIIGVATFERRISPAIRPGLGRCASDDLPPDEQRWYFGKIAYTIRDAQPFLHHEPDAPYPILDPVTCRGFQGFWTLSPQLEATVISRMKPRTP